MIRWDIYEITSSTPIHGVMLRGRIRKFAIEKNQTCMVENASDKENTVRFAVITEEDSEAITGFIKTLAEGISVEKIEGSIKNPVLSKMKVNDESRYKI